MFDRGISQNGLNRQVCAVYAAPDRCLALSKITSKTLVIHGAEDPLIRPEAMCAEAEMLQEIGNYLIRDWQMEDAATVAKYANNRKIWQNLRDGFPDPYSIHDAEIFITRVNDARPRTAFAIATKAEAIGSIGLMLGTDVHRITAAIGYWLAEPFWGKGIMTHAVRFLTDWAFRGLKLHRISAGLYAINTASHRVLEKNGFTREGILRSSVIKDGKILDQFLYSLIGQEGHGIA